MRTRLSSRILVLVALVACGGGGDTTPTTPNAKVVASVAIFAPTSMTVGQSSQFTATAVDAAGQTIAATISWSSSGPGIASVTNAGVVTAHAIGTVTITARATSGSSSATSNIQLTVRSSAAPVLTTVAVSAASTSILTGRTTQLTATPKDQNGTAIAADVTWISSSPGIATVDNAGLVLGVSAGVVTITATATASGASVFSSIQISVAFAPPELRTVALTVPQATIQVGGTVQLAASPRDQYGNPILANVVYGSSAPNIAGVGAVTGLVTGVAFGQATITVTATAGGISVGTSTTITVAAQAAALTSVSVTGASNSVQVRSTLQLTAVPRDQNGGAIAANVQWSSSDQSRATVTQQGLVTGVAVGPVTITASATDGSVTVQGTLQLTVVVPAQVLTSVTISPLTPSLAIGGEVQMTAVARDQTGTIMAAQLSWSSSDASKASVTPGGRVTGVSGGTATITVIASAGGAAVMSSTTVTVSFPLVADVVATFGLTFTPGTVDITVGGTVNWSFEISHNVLFSGGGAPADIPTTSSGTISRVFGTAGTFNYFCSLHGGMNGVVIVH